MNNYEANVVRLMWVMALLGTLPPQPNLGIYGVDVKGDPWICKQPVGTGVPDGPQICTLRKCRNDDANAAFQRGLVTPLESDA